MMRPGRTASASTLRLLMLEVAWKTEMKDDFGGAGHTLIESKLQAYIAEPDWSWDQAKR
jgi:hypothetical protein